MNGQGFFSFPWFSLVMMVRGWEKGAKLLKIVSVAKKQKNIVSIVHVDLTVVFFKELKFQCYMLFLLHGFFSALIWRKKGGRRIGNREDEKRSIISKMQRFVRGEKKQNLGGNRVSEATHAITRLLFFFSLPLLFLSREQGGEWGIAFHSVHDAAF